ncbi:MAG TPA: DUF1735 domain-containing protein [Segetibacter sp.]|jgi:hypothetical protein
MKRIILKNLLLLIAVSATFTSCLKDEGYEDGKYGAVRNTAGREFISIPVAAKNPNPMGLESKSGSQPISLFVVSYDYKDPASSDVSATITVNNALVTAIDPTVTIIPASTYTLPSNTITVKAGQRVSDNFILSLNTSTLDPTKKYGIGFTLTGTSKPSVEIPSNLKDVVYIFSLKNKYDGVYKISYKMEPGPLRIAAGQAAYAGPYVYPNDIHMITTGPNSVVMYNTAYGTGDNHPLQSPATSGFGSTRALFTFDNNDKLISVVNDFPNPSNGRVFAINPNVTTSRYDPTTKTIYAAFIMTQPGFDPLPIYDTLKFTKPR